MRLTLRTLLAYLDDTLEPAQAKLIGQKIAESSTAQELIDRIREVVRRRRLTTPPATGPEARLDPNTVAEYIDNALPGDELAAVEEVALQSDVYLAEIAACHQILTVMLSQPALVPPTAKQRMYGLSRGREAIPYRKPARAPAADVNGPADERADEADEALLLGLPHYSGKGSWLWRLAPLVGVLALVVGIVVAIWQLVGGEGTPKDIAQAPSPPAVNQAAAVAAVQPPGGLAKEPDPTKTPASTEKTTAPEKTEPVKEKTTKEPEPAKTPERPAGGNTATRPGVPPPEAAAPPVSDEYRAVGRHTSPSRIPNVLLKRAPGKTQWQRVARESSVFTTETLMSLPGYRSEVHLESGVHLALWGNLPQLFPIPVLESRLVLHAPPAGIDLDFTLLAGRVVVSNHKPDGAEGRVRVRFFDEVWDLTLLDSDTEFAFEMWGQPEPGYVRDAAKPPEPALDVYAIDLKGQANLKVRYETHRLGSPPGPALFGWNNDQGPYARPRTMQKPPPWAAQLPARNQAVTKALDTLNDRLSGRAPVEVVLAEVVKDDSKEAGALRQLGVYCLGAVDDVAGLLDSLDDDRDQGVRVAAVETLHHWVGLSAENDAKLFKVLAAKYRPGPAEIMMTLLHGFSAEQLGRPETYDTLIGYLTHDKLPIRELAYWRLSIMPTTRAIAQRIPYNASAGGDIRQQAYEKWKQAIPDGQVPGQAGPGGGQPAPGQGGQPTPPRGGQRLGGTGRQRQPQP